MKMLMVPVAILMGCVTTTSGRTLIFNLDGSTGSNLPVNFFHEQPYFAQDIYCDAIYYALLSSKNPSCAAALPVNSLHSDILPFEPSRPFANGKESDVREFMFRYNLAQDNCVGSAEYFHNFCITEDV